MSEWGEGITDRGDNYSFRGHKFVWRREKWRYRGVKARLDYVGSERERERGGDIMQRG